MEKVAWKVEGMHCANCALNVNRALTKYGMQQVAVNPISGDVSFETVEASDNLTKAKSAVEALGYAVKTAAGSSEEEPKGLNAKMLRFLVCLPFTILLLLPMVLPAACWLFVR